MKKLFILLVIAIAMVACNKQKSVNGIVKDFGAPEADGCGWVIEVNGEIYKPTNLDPEYQIHDLHVTFDFRILYSKADCGFQADAYDKIKILKIH